MLYNIIQHHITLYDKRNKNKFRGIGGVEMENRKIILKSSSIYDSVSEEPFSGYVVVEDDKISDVIRSDDNKALDESQRWYIMEMH